MNSPRFPTSIGTLHRWSAQRSFFIAAGVGASLLLGAPVFGASLVLNGDFEQAGNDPAWPEGWTRPKAGAATWETESENKFIRLRATEPKQTLLVHKLVQLPADAKALTVTVRVRVTDLVLGEQAWFDPRVMIDFKDAAGAKLKGAKPLVFRKDTDWVERKVSFLVPEGAAVLEVMPALTQVQAGAFDIDDLKVEVIDPASLTPPATTP